MATPPSGNPEDDLAPILTRWEFSSDQPQVRFLDGIDGSRRIQIRLEAGILQFECVGRPDGLRPQGGDSWLEVLRTCAIRLTVSQCEALRRELMLYHQRAAALFILQEFDAARRDCQHNLEAIALVRAHAESKVDLGSFELIRVAAVLMGTRAEASACVRRRDTQGALAAIDRGLAGLHAPHTASPQLHRDDPPADSAEADMLRAMRDALVPKLPSSQRVDLEVRLQRALRFENYKLAAILRNELRQIGD